MRARDQADGTLVVTHDSTILTVNLLVLALLLAVTAAYDVRVGGRGTDRLIGLFGAGATALVAGLTQLERARFAFDPRRRTLDWDRRWGLRRRRGALPFDRIAEVTVETPIGDDAVPSRRIVLRLADAPPLAITVGYASDGDGEIPRLAERIRTILGQATPAPSDSARTLVDAGRVLDAIKVLRREEGLSLTEAKQRVDALRGTST